MSHEEKAAGEIDDRADHKHDDAADLLILAGIQHDAEAGDLAAAIERSWTEPQKCAEQGHVDGSEQEG